MRLGERDCQVWWATIDDVAPGHDGLLDSIERTRRDRYLRAADRDRFTIGVALTRVLIGAELGIAPSRLRIDRTCQHCRQPHGKPRISFPASTDIHYSISHSGDRIAIAVARTPVGIDVEHLNELRDLEALIDSVLSPTELTDLTRLGSPRRTAGFFRYWTRKESIVKATGHGLIIPLSDLTVSSPDSEPRLVGWDTSVATCPDVSLYDISPGDGYLGNLAVIGKQEYLVSEHDATEILREAD